MVSDRDVERLTGLVALVLRGSGPMTERRIATAIYRRARVRTDARSVRLILAGRPRRFVQVEDRFLFLRRATRWRLVEAGPAQDPGTSGAPVPAFPRRPLRSGAAAAELTFREEEPPPQAIGRLI